MKILYLIIFVLISTFQLNAGDNKIAVINMEKVYSKYYKTSMINMNIREKSELHKIWTEKLKKSVQKMQKEYDILIDSAQDFALSNSERIRRNKNAQKKYYDLESKKKELRNYIIKAEKNLQAMMIEKRKEIISDIKSAVGRKCSIEGYTLVLDSSGKTLNDIPAVVYVNSAYEITEDIIAELNRGHKPRKETEKQNGGKTENNNQ